MFDPVVAEYDEAPASVSYQRDESEAHRLDRNYAELLQELRVAQTGVQILFAFLLGIAFQQRFASLGNGEVDLYLITLVSAAVAAVLLIAPVPIHRILFRRHLKEQLVTITARLAIFGVTFLAISVLSAIMLVVDIAAGLGAAIAVTAALAVVVVAIWLTLPVSIRRRTQR